MNSTRIPLRDLAGGFLRKKDNKKKVHAQNERWGATSLWRMYEQGLEAERDGKNGDGSGSGNGEGRAAVEGA